MIGRFWFIDLLKHSPTFLCLFQFLLVPLNVLVSIFVSLHVQPSYIYIYYIIQSSLIKMHQDTVIKLKSIDQMLQFYQNLKDPIFFMFGPFNNMLWNLKPIIPSFQIINCYDGLNSSVPFVKVSKAAKQNNHYCSSSVECQCEMLKDAEIIQYMKSKGQKQYVFYLFLDKESERLCMENKFRICGVSGEKFQFLGSKLNTSEMMQKIDIKQIPYQISKISSFEDLSKAGEKLNTNRFVVQLDQCCSGEGTFFIFNQSDYQKSKKHIENGREVKIMPYLNVKSFAVDVIAMKNGVLVGPLLIELIGYEQLIANKGGFCGSQLLQSYFKEQLDQQIKQKAFDYSKKIGRLLYDSYSLKGTFGIDFLIDVETFQVYFQEINPRITGQTVFTNQFYKINDKKIPFTAFHFLQYLNAELDINFDELNQHFFNSKTYNKEYSQLLFFTANEQQSKVKIKSFPTGVYKIQNNSLKYTEKIYYDNNEIQQNELLIFPYQGYIKGHITYLKRSRDQHLNLLPQTEQIIALFLQKYNISIEKCYEVKS